jgi:hypothetical protein
MELDREGKVLEREEDEAAAVVLVPDRAERASAQLVARKCRIRRVYRVRVSIVRNAENR